MRSWTNKGGLAVTLVEHEGSLSIIRLYANEHLLLTQQFQWWEQHQARSQAHELADALGLEEEHNAEEHPPTA